jgi:hypothetical protein
MSAKRRSVKKKERLSDCECCGYPLSHRHHLFPVCKYGENEETIQLCANCHELWHILYSAHVFYEKNPTATKKIARVAASRLYSFIAFREKTKFEITSRIKFLQESVCSVYQIRKEKGE